MSRCLLVGAPVSLVLSIVLVMWSHSNTVRVRFDAAPQADDRGGAIKGTFTLLFTNDLHRCACLFISLSLLAVLTTTHMGSLCQLR